MRALVASLVLLAGCTTDPVPDGNPTAPSTPPSTLVGRMENQIATMLIEQGLEDLENSFPEFALQNGRANTDWDPVLTPFVSREPIRALADKLERSVDLTAVEPALRRDVEHLQFGARAAPADPVILIDPVSGPQAAFPRMLIHQQPARNEEELRLWLERLETLSDRTREILAVARTRGARVTSADGIDRQCASLRSGKPFTDGDSSILREDFQTQLHRARLEPDVARRLLSRADELIAREVSGVCDQVIAFAEDPPAPRSVDYAARLQRSITRPTDPAQLHSEASRVLEALVAEGLPFPADTLPTDPQVLLNEAGAIVFDIDERLSDFIGFSPAHDLDVAIAPAFIEPARSGGGEYIPGPGLGTTYLHPGDLAYLGLDSTVRRFALPGHHAIPRTRIATLVPAPAFERGWALYVALTSSGAKQHLALEAARTVADTGIHALGWSEAEARAIIEEQTGIPSPLATAMLARILALPGDGPAAFAGYQAVAALRDRAEMRLGDEFDARAFHDALLAEGPRPLDVLEGQIAEWMARSR